MLQLFCSYQDRPGCSGSSLPSLEGPTFNGSTQVSLRVVEVHAHPVVKRIEKPLILSRRRDDIESRPTSQEPETLW